MWDLCWGGSSQIKAQSWRKELIKLLDIQFLDTQTGNRKEVHRWILCLRSVNGKWLLIFSSLSSEVCSALCRTGVGVLPSLGLPSSLGPGGGSGVWNSEVQRQLGSREL